MKRLLLLITFISVFVLFNYAQTQKSKVVHPTKVSTAIYFDEIPSLKDLPPVDDQYYIDNWGKEVAEGAEHESEEAPNYSNWKDEGPDPVWQKENGWLQSPKSLIQNFAGQSSPYMPSDCNGTVGPNHFMQTVNTTYAIWNKTGTQVVIPTAMNTLFSGVAGSGNNDGDPLILFDEQADKWVAVEFSLDKYIHGGTYDYMLIAVSQTNDPTGAWWRWSFIMNGLPDYEKMGIWNDGYYMGTNLGSTSSSGDDVYVFERNVMIAGGASPQQVQFHNPNRPNNGFHCIMPLDMDGSAAPSGSPGQFITINDNAWGGSDELWIYECNVNWSSPTSSTFSRTQQLSVPSFDSQFNSWGTGDIAQSGTSQLVDAQPYVLMVRGQYKNFGTTQSLVCMHTVDVDGTNHAGERWYELEKTSQTDPTWSVRQSGTYSPDANSRWMGSIAINDNHEIAMGYSISSSSMSPNIRYCGQSASGNASATGLMDIAESANLASSTQSQGSTNRWGDYSLMTVDPTDGVTFWYTDEYYNSGKKTRIISFTIGSSVLTAQFSGTPTSVNIGNSVTFTDASYGPNPITSWNWNFPGGTPSSYSGQNPPLITYNTVGTYDVTLTVGDGSTTDVETKTSYISAINCTVSSYPWSEGFENGGNIPDCWSNEYVTDTQDWAYQAGGHSGNPGSAHSGSYNAYLYNGSSTANVTKLVTPQLDMSGLSSATLTFWHTQAFWSPDQDELRIYYKTSLGGSWNLLATYTNDITSWTQETINLPGLSGDYYIAFEGTAQYGHGVCVDDVNVDGSTGSSAPVANFVADNTSPAVGQTVTFTDQTTNLPTSWAWTFSPSTVTFVGGTGSSSQNPQVTFDAAGSYTVTLTATNAFGSDDEVKTNYITANVPPPSIPPYVDDFEPYTSGNYLAVQSTYWTTWSGQPGSGEDGYVSADHSLSGTQSVKVDGTTDLVLELGDKTSGKYMISFNVYVPSGNYGYYNLLQSFNGSNSEWGLEVFFDTGGSGHGNAGGSDSFTFSFSYNNWINVQNIIDLNNDWAEVWIDGNLVKEWQWSTGALGTGTNDQLGGLDMYAWNVNGTPLYYFDDLSYFEIIKLNLTAMLEGPYNQATGLMNADLNSGNYLPLSQPFNVTPWNYNGTEGVSSFSDPTIIDWILVELRDATSSDLANPSTIIDSKACFIKSNGQVVDIDGNTVMEFRAPIFNNLFVVIFPRNHIPVISGNAVTQTSGVYTYDFSTAEGQARGGAAGHKNIGGGVWGMFSGNSNGDNDVNDTDKDTNWMSEVGTSGYLSSDVNMDGQANNQDKNDMWVPNNGKTSQVPQ